MAAPDISREAVKRRAADYARHWRAIDPDSESEDAAMLLALRDALDAAEAERDRLRKELRAAEAHAEYARAAEREACAQVADVFQTAHGEAIAKGIRARGEAGT